LKVLEQYQLVRQVCTNRTTEIICLASVGIFLRIGHTSFGGPVAHLGNFRDEFVSRRNCLSEHDYADLVALCQFLPGPASSQVGMGMERHKLFPARSLPLTPISAR
jgi:chromate transporter